MLAVLLAVSLVVAGLAWKREYDRALAQERVALAHGLALHAADLRDAAPGTARNLGVAAVKIHSDGQTRAGLIDTLVARHGSELTPNASRKVALSGDGRLALTGDGDEVSVWDLTTWLDPKVILKSDRVATLKGHKEGVDAVALSFDGRTALTGDEGATFVWDLTDPAKPIRVAVLAGERNTDSVRALALSHDGRTAVIANDVGDMAVWNLTDRSRPARLSVTRAHTSSIRGLGLSADGRTAVTVDNDDAVTVWDLADPLHPVKSADLPPPERSERSMVATAMSANGRVVLVGNGPRVEVWNLDDRSRPARTAVFEVPLGYMYDMTLTSDKKTALLAGPSDSVFLWDLSDLSRPTRLAALKGYAREIESVAFSADGGIALAAGPSGVSLWDLRNLAEVVADPEEAACHGNTNERLSKADWARYAGDADWSDYGGEVSGGLAVCFITPDPT
ncbi:WD40 repeat domain-containing protein [Streptosporangium amethystogenes subsp. fukuiense]|uniref:WD40 repeat domain-containing protein n=1 Tax=Streptosporangium amethystogenes subsp. fukuiense TaxID=698418 RepID=A0ABW2T071_9ACTN